jgi:hypothetical protein
MKTRIGIVALLLLVGLTSSCATATPVAEFEEESVGVMSPEEKADLEKERRLQEKIEWSHYID